MEPFKKLSGVLIKVSKPKFRQAQSQLSKAYSLSLGGCRLSPIPSETGLF
jgi:hypothetical protein